MLLTLRVNSLGKFFNTDVDGSGGGLPQTAFGTVYARPLDRWIDESARGNLTYGHAWELDRGTSGPGGGVPDLPLVHENIKNAWPGLRFDGESALNLNLQATKEIHGIDAGAVSDYTIYAVLKVADASSGLSKLISCNNGGAPNWMYIQPGTNLSNIQFFDGVGIRGAVAGSLNWQILVFVLDGSGANQAKIRVNGADHEVGLNYVRARLISTDAALACQYNGTDLICWKGDLCDTYVFDGVHTSQQIDDIEAHLAEKFGISLP